MPTAASCPGFAGLAYCADYADFYGATSAITINSYKHSFIFWLLH